MEFDPNSNPPCYKTTDEFPAISCSSLHYKISYKPPSTKVYLQGWESDSRCTAV
ncbi:UNVERIFIED_CONTAM: hypothetical protein FKN15_035616 [Acipenser sinensis]